MKFLSGFNWRSLRILLHYIWDSGWQLRVRLLMSIILTVLVIGINLSIPFIFKYIVNGLTVHNVTYAGLSMLLLGYGISWILNQFLTNLRMYNTYNLLKKGLRLLDLKIVDKLLSLSLRFHIEKQTGALSNYIHQAETGFDSIMWGLTLYIVPTLIELSAGLGIISFFYGIKFGIVLLLLGCGYFLISLPLAEKAILLRKAYNQKRANARAKIMDSILNYETIKIFNNEEFEHDRINYLLKEQEKSAIQSIRQDMVTQIIQFLLIGAGLTYITWNSGVLAYSGSLSAGDFVLINGYMLQFISPLNHLGYIWQNVRKGLQDIASILELLEREPEIKDRPQAQPLPKLEQAEVHFENVHFGYDAQKEILKGISFTVPKGKTLAIVGPTGSGKSTITKLLFRFYDVTKGEIILNGYPLDTITQQSLHVAIGIIPQDTILFHDSLYYNIAYARPSASKKDIEYVVKLAQLSDFIESLPQGYDTIVGERGLKLSGGEKQRVAIARLLLKNPSLFIFDEATSSLDSITEKEIQKNLEEICKGKTTIIIAHRLSTITHADHIIVLDKGSITEQGTFKELLHRNGQFSCMYNQQQTSC